MKEEFITLNMIELNEGYPVEYYPMRMIDEYYKKEALCSHAKEQGYIRAIVAYNEGNYNSTCICWDCLMEQMGVIDG